MYCRNCGKEVDDKAVVCVGCGVPPLKGTAYCQACGKDAPADAQVCTQCGVPLAAGASVGDEKMWGMLAHLGIIILGFIGPLIVWLVKGKESAFIDDQGKEALNQGILIAIAWVAAGVLSFIGIGFLLYPVLWLYQIIFPILAGVQANSGNKYRYPVAIRFIK